MVVRIERRYVGMKKYKRKIIISSLVTLLPILIGVIFWKQLPDTIATHFDMNNEANGWSSKAFAVFGFPMLLLGMHILCIFVTLNDPKKHNIGNKMMALTFWMVPVISNIASLAMYGYALKMQVNISLFMNILIGVLFIVLGNYMGKTHQNYTVGIKLPWTLNSKENWNKTHRLASRLFIVGGVVMIIGGILQIEIAVLILVILIAIIPGIYSFILYKKKI